MTDDPSSETIGQRLRRLRLERGMSQRELSAPGVSYAYISRIEAGTRQPSVKALRKLAAKLGVSADYLETGSDLRRQEERELELADAELHLRLGDDAPQAEETLSRLLQDAVADGDAAAATRARIGLGFAAYSSGRYEDAVAQLEHVADHETTSPSLRPDVYSTLGRAYAALGRADRAVELFEECMGDVEENAPQDLAARTRFATLLSYALADSGHLERAEAVVAGALASAGDLEDSYTQIRLYWSLARLTWMQNRPTAALRHARRAIALLEATEDKLHLARAHLLCAAILTGRDDHDAAARHLSKAERLFGARPEPLDLASLRSEQAKHAAATGRGAQAVALAQEALSVLGDDDPAERGLALSALARGLELQGDLETAGASFRESLELLHAHGRSRDVQRTAAAWSQALRRAGREDDAADVEKRYSAPVATQPLER